MDAGDAAWRAWNRLGVRAWDHMRREAPGPTLLNDLAAAIGPELDRVTRLVLDELEVRLYGEARERVVASVRSRMVTHTLWAVVDGIRDELTRPDPVPYSPPAIGSWIRERRPRSSRQPEPKWVGLWHRFSGDLAVPPLRINDVDGRSMCGVRVSLRSVVDDAAVADVRPSIDACRRCSRIAA
jgi:hypothetical protein